MTFHDISGAAFETAERPLSHDDGAALFPISLFTGNDTYTAHR